MARLNTKPPEWPLLRIGGVAGAIVALATFLSIWSRLGLPTPAWSQDVDRLEDQQLGIAGEVYQQKLDDLTVLGARLKATPEASEQEKALIEKQIRDTERKIEQIEQRKIELSR